jgi:hypothetical protein
MLQSPLSQLDLQRLAPDHPLERRDLGLVLLQQFGRLDVAVQRTGIELADPYPD